MCTTGIDNILRLYKIIKFDRTDTNETSSSRVSEQGGEGWVAYSEKTFTITGGADIEDASRGKVGNGITTPSNYIHVCCR